MRYMRQAIDLASHLQRRHGTAHQGLQNAPLFLRVSFQVAAFSKVQFGP